tara:strand:+ start:7368 stop:7775 length:408 start_codon:yes stop_codon:yes gene_type:complete
METTGSHDGEVQRIRARARRLRLPNDVRVLPKVTQRLPFDRLGCGALAALIIDLVGVAVSAFMLESSMLLLPVFGPLVVVWLVPELAGTTVVAMALACVTERWRFAAGLLLFQLAAVLLGFVWLGLLSGGILPMY